MVDKLITRLVKLKNRLAAIERSSMNVSAIETRETLINPLLRELGWKFDLKRVRCQFQPPGSEEMFDYAYFSKTNTDRPIIIVQAKQLGSDLEDPKVVQDLCRSLGSCRVRCGCLTDGNKYVFYASNGIDTSEHRMMLSLSVKDIDTHAGIGKEVFSKHLMQNLSRVALDRIDREFLSPAQQRQENLSIGEMLGQLLSKPFDTLVIGTQRETGGKSHGSPVGFRISRSEVEEHFKLTMQILSEENMGKGKKAG